MGREEGRREGKRKRGEGGKGRDMPPNVESWIRQCVRYGFRTN